MHLAITNELVSVALEDKVDLPYWPLDLLRAYAAGMSLETYAALALLNVEEVRELDLLLRTLLKATSGPHAVLRGHVTRALQADDPLNVDFGEALTT
ncbi:hypothetical protein ABR737_00880 [Streptomyces sp. Edi2]|uniref:hypothetical protein n=1 Tax=Streptomyces sp. Edi2 TaxID=3162528 RepID=UPI003305A4C6